MVELRCAGRDTQRPTPTAPVSPSGAEHESDKASCAPTVPETVMAEQVTKDVVKEAQSMGHPAPIDEPASTTSNPAANGELPSGPATTTSTTPEHTSAATHAAATPDGPKQAGTPPQHAEKPCLNGDSGEHAIADASGGSDTDISRPGSVDQSKREANHVRTNSMKKPSTFKSVSFTKNFLKSAVSTPTARPGDKAAPAAPATPAAVLTAKPRLVAKSGAGNTPRTLGKVNGAGSGPDASKVWNKNQPVPVPPPKQFTDEELKQQYGIHLATRLQADEAGKEAKWADIDDDEDDWAPDTVQWMDGTKSSGAVAENEMPTAEEPRLAAKAPEAPQETARPAPVVATNTPKPSVTGGAKTILKPGTHVQPATGKSSLVLKGQPEKPTLVTKPSDSGKRSPWAVLPPVEKLPPIPINPPAQHQQPQQRYSQRDSYSYEPMSSLPAKEIAPDDFNRAWRDDRGTRPELFNSQSGRYEPVNNDMRRGPVREPNFRQQPSVLQRRSQDGGPAEPSAAFQTSRASGDGQTWGRRRNSSNVSGGNGRRMSLDRRPPDMPTGPVSIDRRGSHSVNGADPVESASSRHPSAAQTISPNIANAHPVSPFGSAASSGAQDLPNPVAAPPAEDPVEVQKRLMADKIERARLKKQQEREAEEKEEAERKERLAKRLAAMGPPKVKEQPPSQVPERSPRKDKATPASVQSPPKPPVPTVDGEIAQYGMMKVHHAQPVKKASPPVAPMEPAHSPSRTKAQTENQARHVPSHGQQPALPFDNLTRDSEKARQTGEQSKYTGNQSEDSAPSGPRSQATPGNWQPATAQPARGWTSQVWGPPPTKDRALGNGTFGSAYDRSQTRSSSQQQLPVQPPSTAAASTSLHIAPKLPHSHPANSAPVSQPMHPQAGPLPAQTGASARPGPIAPPPGKGWGNFAAHIAQDDRALVLKTRQDLERLGGEIFRPEMQETYKDQLGQAQTTMHDKIGGSSAKKDEAVKLGHDGPSPQPTMAQGPPLQQATGPRASRFFPRSIEISQPTMTATNKAESPPPPPETETHPAFTGSSGQPMVKLPKPSPVVRLPPAAVGGAASAEAPVSMPPRGNHGLGARPLAMNPEWQARFNKLLEKPGTSPAQAAQAASNRSAIAAVPTTPSKPRSLPVAASSKAAFDVRGNAGAATVSLPYAPAKRNFANDRGRDALTRKGTEVLFEDREFGSLPTVKLSKVSHRAANEPVAKAPLVDDPVLVRFRKIENPFTQRRLEAFDHERSAQRIEVVIRITNMRDGITKSMPRRRGPRMSNQHNKQKRNSTVPSGATPTGSKDRPRKPSQQGQTDRPSSSSHPTPTNAWFNNNRSTPGTTPAHQATTWARRAAAPVH
ncbi:hypothetical protein BDU57DRAFT_536577 [Ampelomyces quisqualis]|uniref:Uncharacterized protein n=1 Tax=Ampelomyces quisqualis TaxID=50730 RepID=A0A6A5R0H7_AMPQU|nr:hypothetical protein BDU57DRAFT_536577 [Ampelomyces quisqualis]